MHTGEEREFDDLLLMLKETRGFDFTGYKRATLRRRVGRRLRALKLESVEEYRDYLELEPAEFTTLFDSLLINVTGFFRDPPAWQVLRERAIPSILAAKGGRSGPGAPGAPAARRRTAWPYSWRRSSASTSSGTG